MVSEASFGRDQILDIQSYSYCIQFQMEEGFRYSQPDLSVESSLGVSAQLPD